MDAETLLEIARVAPGQNRFALGTFEKGITLYRQQVRALNLIYALAEAKASGGGSVVPPTSTVAIIGGGAFGMMAAVAAAHVGFKAVLLERHQMSMPVQRGCATRWLHPRLYDWPALESETRLARLPFMPWSAGMAGQVVLDLEDQFLRAKSACGTSLRRVLGVTRFLIRPTGVSDFEVVYSTQADGNQTEVASAVIYSVGFGAEIGAKSQYWRNDCFDQHDLNFIGKAPVNYLVSGMGDGALIDTFRLTLRDYSQDTIFSDIFGAPDSALVDALRAIRDEPHPKPPIFERLHKLENEELSDPMRGAIDHFRSRRRNDTAVMLNGEAASFREALDKAAVSFGHSALAYCGYRAGAFRYIPGRIDRTKLYARPLADDVGEPVTRANLEKVEIVVRHGSNREEALKAAGLDKAEIKRLDEQRIHDSGQAIYPLGWWGKFTLGGISGTTRVEFVPPALMMQASTFVSSVADFLEYLLDRRSGGDAQNFRVALHRLVRFDGEEVFQQITPYFGRIPKKEGAGRIFPVLGGIVGLACRTGSLVVAKRQTEEQFAAVWEAAKFDRVGARAIEPYVDSLMACPFFAPPAGSSERVCMVLFIDSADPNFFDDETKGALAVACKGFVGLLEGLVERGAIRALPTHYAGYEVRPRDDALMQSLGALGVEFTEPSVQAWKDELTFRKLNSLELEISRLAQAT